MTPQTRPATYQDVLDAPEHVTAEIIDGELHLERPHGRFVREILSAGSRGRDRVAKSRIYSREGVGFYWVVDPIECELEAFERLESGQWALVGVFDGNAAVRVKPFDGVDLELGRIWGREG
jgi:Uma2 family endonuclease